MIQRRNRIQVDGFASLSLASIICIPIVGISFMLTIGGSLAIMIVLSLIPTFLPIKTLPNNIENSFKVVAIYRTDLINGSLLTVDNTKVLSISLNNALHLSGISNINNAEFIPPITCNDTNDTQIVIMSASCIGHLLELNFSSLYPKNCNTKNCRQQFIDKTLLNINTTYSNFSLPFYFTNNSTFNTQLNFCAFNDYSICQVNIKTCEDDECSSDCDDDDDVCQDEDDNISCTDNTTCPA